MAGLNIIWMPYGHLIYDLQAGLGANQRTYMSLYIWRELARICRKFRFWGGAEMHLSPYVTGNKKIFSKQPFCVFTPCALLSNKCFKRMYLSRINSLCGKRLHQILAGAICEKPLIPFLPIFISMDFRGTYNAFQCPHRNCILCGNSDLRSEA